MSRQETVNTFTDGLVMDLNPKMCIRDRLYALDLQSRVKDITDEEINAALEQEKANP